MYGWYINHHRDRDRDGCLGDPRTMAGAEKMDGFSIAMITNGCWCSSMIVELCICIYIYICMYVYVYVYIYIYVHMYIYIYVCLKWYHHSKIYVNISPIQTAASCLATSWRAKPVTSRCAFQTDWIWAPKSMVRIEIYWKPGFFSLLPIHICWQMFNDVPIKKHRGSKINFISKSGWHEHH